MKVKFLKAATGAVKGIHVKEYGIGSICEVNGVQIDKDLADVFISRGIAEIYEELLADIVELPEEKAFIPEVENKALQPIIRKKGKK